VFYIISLTVQQNYFSDPYPAKILDLSAKAFFPYFLGLSLLSIRFKKGIEENVKVGDNDKHRMIMM